MKVFEYECIFLCEPIYNNCGRLKAIEILTRFSEPDGKLLSYSAVEVQLKSHDRWNIFCEQMREVMLWANYISKHNLLISLNIDGDVAEHLVNDHAILQVLRSAPYINLEVSENFERIDLSSNISTLFTIREYIDLWLDDIGSGSRDNFDLLSKRFFKVAKIDKYFFWKSIIKNGLIDRVIKKLEYCAEIVVVEGVEKNEQLLYLMKFNNCWFQGYIFEHKELDSLDMIPLQIDLTNYLK